MARITIHQLARKLGVSAMSVSVALRGKPGVSDQLRERILTEARRLGYSPDPLAWELMERVRSRRLSRGSRTIAFVNTFRRPELFAVAPTYAKFVRGAREQAEAYGWTMEEFQAFGAGMGPARLARVLSARGIDGVVVGPRWLDEPDIEFPWGDFTAVLLGETHYGAGLYRVCCNQQHASLLALKKLVERGYRRIGLISDARYETPRDFDFSLGVEAAKREMGRRAHFVARLGETSSHEVIAAFVREERLDALVSLAGPPATITELRGEGGHRLGYANLDCHEGQGWSGIDQHSDEIGAAAVAMMHELLVAGARGEQPDPRIVLIEGTWREGWTAPEITPAGP
jgi:LacI family transcriptional regulator